MTRTIIAVGILVLLTATATAIAAVEAATAAPATAVQRPSEDVSKLAYNPTYDLWYFVPTGRPRNLGASIMAAYKEHRPGGVCYSPDDNWYFCATSQQIVNDFKP